MSKPSYDLSIIILAYQEAKRIGGSLDALASYLGEHPELGEVEVLVVVADSPDGTADVARAKGGSLQNFRVIEAGSRVGKGRDTRTGMMEASGRYKLFMDADLATPLVHLQDIKSAMDRNVPVAVCVRNLSESHTGLRKFISSFGNLLVRVVLGLDIKDTQCGFKAFRADVADELFRRQTVMGWGFDMEVLAIASARGYEIETIPAPDWQDVAGGTFQNVAVTGALDTFKDLLKIKWNFIRGVYKEPHFTYEPTRSNS